MKSFTQFYVIAWTYKVGCKKRKTRTKLAMKVDIKSKHQNKNKATPTKGSNSHWWNKHELANKYKGAYIIRLMQMQTKCTVHIKYGHWTKRLNTCRLFFFVAMVILIRNNGYVVYHISMKVLIVTSLISKKL